MNVLSYASRKEWRQVVIRSRRNQTLPSCGSIMHNDCAGLLCTTLLTWGAERMLCRSGGRAYYNTSLKCVCLRKRRQVFTQLLHFGIWSMQRSHSFILPIFFSCSMQDCQNHFPFVIAVYGWPYSWTNCVKHCCKKIACLLWFKQANWWHCLF